MKVAAPGKVLLTGAYAVLEGAPAIVVAVDRHAIAEGDALDPTPPREVALAFGEAPAPRVDVSSLYEGPQKLGLGSSAAALVAALGVRELRAGHDLADPNVRRRLLDEARAAHRKAQGGGSGVDVAAAVYGGVLRFVGAGDTVAVRSVELPPGFHFSVFFSGESARTSELIARVQMLVERDQKAARACAASLREAAEAGADAVDQGDARAFLAAAELTRQGLAALGAAAEVPIVPQVFSLLHDAASHEGAVFFPSGAGGGDIGVYAGLAPPSPEFVDRARVAGMIPLALRVDAGGVRPLVPPRG